jgi:hypothetical protein
MNLIQRLRFGKSKGKDPAEELLRIAIREFGHLTECFIIVGYSKKERKKFLLRCLPGEMQRDALCVPLHISTQWIKEDPGMNNDQ